MLYLFSGTPGSGKSLHQARNIYDRLRFGHLTVTNFPVNVSAVRHARGQVIELDNLEITPSRLVNISREYFEHHPFREGAIAVYIDEAQLLFNCRETLTSASRAAWVSFFTQHRKYGFNIYLVAQFDRMIDRQIRSLIEYEVIHRKVSAFGWRGWFLIPFFGNFCAITMWYPLKERLGSEFFRLSRRVMRLYDSFGTFEKK